MEDRVLIGHPTEEDETDYRQAVRASASVLEPWIFLRDTAESFDVYLERSRQDDQYSYLVRHLESGHLAGFVNANNVVRGALRSAYLGYGAFGGGVGKGLMQEALSLVIDDLFDNKELHRVEANIQPNNERSVRLVERLGFRKEGYSSDYLYLDGAWRDHERWAFTAEMRL